MIRDERGFTLIEALVAAVVLSLGVLAAFTALDSSRRLTLESERQTTMAHRAQAELESLKALPYGELALTGTSASWSGSQSDPNGVNMPPGACPSGSAVPTYQPDHSSQPSAAVEPLVINGCPYTVGGQTTTASGGVVNPFQTWTNGSFSGKVYDFVTYTSDPSCDGTYCPTSNDYKRLTVVVTLDAPQGGSQRLHPAIVSTYVADPNLNSQWNINHSPTTQCTLGSTTGSCSQNSPGTPVISVLCDASATSGCKASGPPCSGNPLDLSVVSGMVGGVQSAPMPDATSSSLPPGNCASTTTTTATTTTTTTTTTTSGGNPTLPCYATDVLAGCQGLPICPLGGTNCSGGSTSSTCGSAPPSDNTQAHTWVGSPIANGSSITLTGAGAMTTFLESTGATSVNATLCLRLYTVPDAGLGDPRTNLFASPISTTISASVNATAGAPAPVTFTFPTGAITANTAVSATNGALRIEFAVWVAGTVQPVELVYDQAPYASEITLMRQ